MRFRGWKFHVGRLGDGFYIQVRFDAPCTETKRVETQRGRKMYVSPHAIADEVVKTCWVAVELAIRHEAMEEFIVDGLAPFHPHTDFDALLDVQASGAHVAREALAQL